MCDGSIKQGVGCTKYAGSDLHDQDSLHENMMRNGGLGFGIALSSNDAMMSMHLQANHNVSPDEARDIVTLNSPKTGES